MKNSQFWFITYESEDGQAKGTFRIKAKTLNKAVRRLNKLVRIIQRPKKGF